MFNVTVKGNVRCNGLHPSGPGGMVKRNIQSSTMSPNRGHSQHQHQHQHKHHHHHQTITDSKLKFSDRLKAYLSKDGLRSDASELDDPYTFSDCEIKTTSTSTSTATTITTLNHNNTGHTTTLNHNHNSSSNLVQVPPVSVQVQMPVSVTVPVPVRNKLERIHKLDTLQQNNKKVIKVNNTTTVHHHHHNLNNHVDVTTATAIATGTTTTKTKTTQATNISNINNINVNNPTLSSIKNSSSDNQNHTTTGSGKTMSRLQAQIARNKVTVKHNRNSPDLKIDKNYFDKNTKHSIIGLVNNVNSNNKINRRLPSGKPIPAHLRARRVSKNSTSTQDSLQRISSTSSSINHSNHFISSNSPKTTTNKCSLRAPSNARWHAPQPYGPLAGCRTSITPGKSKIDVSDSDEDEGIGIYQRHWFNKELEILSSEESSRESRLEITRQELKRQLLQMKRSKIGSYRTLQSPTKTSANSVRHYISTVAQSLAIEGRLRRRKRSPTKTKTKRPNGLMLGRNCENNGCTRVALPCTKHCVMHIMNNQDQVLFDHCTAKFADNTQCSVPVFDITHELPLCIEHARKRDNYNRMCLETKPKKPRRKIKPSAMIRPQKRNKKRKRSTTTNQQKITDVNVDNTTTSPTAIKSTITTNATELNVCETSSAYESSEEIALGALSETEFVTINGEDHIGDQDVVEQVLAMQEEVGGDLELVVEQTLVTQASRLLEETDFTNVLNQIPADEFNDLFAVDRNGEYEPSREETEELERALEAVDKDVQSLEKLSATQGLLDSLLDEHTLVESLVQIPDVFHHNGYEVIDSPASHQSSPRQLQAFHHPAIHGVDGMLPVQPPQAHAPS